MDVYVTKHISVYACYECVYLCASVFIFVSVFVCVFPDGNDSRAERGHMVMWHDSGVMLIRQNCDL